MQLVIYKTYSQRYFTTRYISLLPELAVNITVSYIPPPGAELGPNQYRAGSGPVTVTCMATGPVSYQWSSTCRRCPFKTENSSSVTRNGVHSGDTGIHTCTATSGSINKSETINFRVVGKPSKARDNLRARELFHI